jgi:hypothetical protein
MAKAYIQPVMKFEDGEYGTLYVYMADGTTLADVYDPVSGDPILNPIDLDGDGYAEPFHVDTDSIYSLEVRSFTG